ncbi:MAG: hypothetical protein DCC71_06420 [Proteobacteria bacterium]|nr:MAG: hypothetical protein DCC71_06420 [Pseudomonadota bacterium]
MQFRTPLLLCLAAALAAPSVARAGDGRIEINHACATGTGCHPNDSPGFPVTMNFGGAALSYVLTSDLVIEDVNTTGISLPYGATLDLNGFQIRGPVTCTGRPAVCDASGAGSGVSAAGGAVRNGSVRGMGGAGIVGSDARVENVTIESNGGNGIAAGSSQGLLVSNCRIVANGGDGISTAAGSPRGSLVVNTSILSNAGDGLEGSGLLLIGSMVDLNGGYAVNSNAGQANPTYKDSAFYNSNGGNANAQVLGGRSLGDNWCGDAAC